MTMKKAEELLDIFYKERIEILDTINKSNHLTYDFIIQSGLRLKELSDKILVLEYALSE